jgi:group I intron endonuclease
MKGVLKRSNSIIFSAVLNYGVENFSLTILEYCLPEEQFKREEYYIKTLQPEYNILQKAPGGRGRPPGASPPGAPLVLL